MNCLRVQVSQWYELVVFTASMEIYGSAVADKLDNNRNILKRRYYRQVLHRSPVAQCTNHRQLVALNMVPWGGRLWTSSRFDGFDSRMLFKIPDSV